MCMLHCDLPAARLGDLEELEVSLHPAETDGTSPQKHEAEVQKVLLKRFLSCHTLTEKPLVEYLSSDTVKNYCLEKNIDLRGATRKEQYIARLMEHVSYILHYLKGRLTVFHQHKNSKLGKQPCPEIDHNDDCIPLPADCYTVLGQDLIELAREDIRNTTFPSWMKRSPQRFDSGTFGKLSGEERKTLMIVSLPITLTRVWRKYETPGAQEMDVDADTEKLLYYRERRYEYLDNLLHFSVAIRLAQRRVVTEQSLCLYERHIVAYLEGFKRLFPTQRITPYQHFSLHVPEVCRRWGPAETQDTNTSEFWNEKLQDINTNDKFCERMLFGAADTY